MTVGILHKTCRKCNQDKPYTAFYKRPHASGETPGHYLSECKSCMKRRSNQTPKLSKHQSGYAHEAQAIEYLASKGIHALPGKALAYANVDIVAWGCVRIEVKMGTYNRLVEGDSYLFGLSNIQQVRGLLCDLVMLIVPYPAGPAYHLFEPDYLGFYRPDDPGQLKSAFYYRPGAVKPRRGIISSYENAMDHFITEDDMASARDNVQLIWRKVQMISKQLEGGG